MPLLKETGRLWRANPGCITLLVEIRLRIRQKMKHKGGCLTKTQYGGGSSPIPRNKQPDGLVSHRAFQHTQVL
jgi:hypothetical protein